MRAVQQNIGRGTEDSTEPPPAPSGGESDNTAKPDTAKLTYHRIPMCDDKAPTDQVIRAVRMYGVHCMRASICMRVLVVHTHIHAITIRDNKCIVYI